MMNNNAIATVNSTIDMTILMNLLKENKATVIIINNGTPIDTNIIDTTSTEVIKKQYVFNHHAYYTTTLNKVLISHGIKVKEGKGGAKRGYISERVFKELINQLETKEVTMRKVKFLFNALDGAGYKEEGRGLKNDIVFEVLNYIKENNLAKEYAHGVCNKVKVQYELDNLVDKLSQLILTNDFQRKFHEFLRKDEVVYTTYKLATETETA